MWPVDTPWFDVSVILAVFGVGSVVFGRFEQHKSRGRRVAKIVIATVIFVGLSQSAGRVWSLAFLALAAVGAGVLHLWWLPKHGINGWTAEPYDEYLKLVQRRASSRGARPAGKQ